MEIRGYWEMNKQGNKGKGSRPFKRDSGQMVDKTHSDSQIG